MSFAQVFSCFVVVLFLQSTHKQIWRPKKHLPDSTRQTQCHVKIASKGLTFLKNKLKSSHEFIVGSRSKANNFNFKSLAENCKMNRLVDFHQMFKKRKEWWKAHCIKPSVNFRTFRHPSEFFMYIFFWNYQKVIMYFYFYLFKSFI